MHSYYFVTLLLSLCAIHQSSAYECNVWMENSTYSIDKNGEKKLTTPDVEEEDDMDVPFAKRKQMDTSSGCVTLNMTIQWKDKDDITHKSHLSTGNSVEELSTGSTGKNCVEFVEEMKAWLEVFNMFDLGRHNNTKATVESSRCKMCETNLCNDNLLLEDSTSLRH